MDNKIKTKTNGYHDSLEVPDSPRSWHDPMAPVDFNQTIQFLKTAREEGESLSSFYHRITMQASKCSIFCCVGRLIRDRLIQAVNNERVLNELGKMTDPSIEDILALDNEKHVWHLIISFLSLADIDALAKTSRILAEVIDSYVKEGGNITIGADLLQEYPLSVYKDLYMRFSSATSLTLRHIKEHDLPELFSCFPRLVHLQMCNMVITEEVTCLPRSLNQLTLSEFKMERHEFESWISSMNGTLKSLHLDRLETSFFNVMDVPAPRPIRLQNVCPQLQSLTIKERELQFKFGLTKLKSLKIVTDLLVQGLKLHACASELETLYLDVRRFDEEVDDIGDLAAFDGKISSLTLRSWPGGDEGYLGRELDRLRIIERVDPKHREEIEQLAVTTTTTLDVEYLEYATEDQENLLLTALNDALLLKIIEYLPVEDCIVFSRVDERVHKLVTTKRFSELTIDERNNCLFLMDRCPGFFKRIAPSIRQLSVTECRDVLWILPHCTALKELELIDVRLQENHIPWLPVENVDRVVLLGCASFWREETTTLLEEYLCKLTNLREVGLDMSYEGDILINLFERNRDTLQKVSVRLTEDADWEAYEEVWKVIGALPQLKELVIDQQFQEDSSEMPDRPQMKSLFSAAGDRLLKLDTDVCGTQFGDVINGGLLPKVQDMTLYSYRGRLASNDLAALCSLKELRRLRLECRNGNIKLWNSDAMLLIQSLPNLEDLIVVGFQSTVRFGVELREYLQREGRRLKFHSREL